jgi:hypothetical protein
MLCSVTVAAAVSVARQGTRIQLETMRFAKEMRQLQGDDEPALMFTSLTLTWLHVPVFWDTSSSSLHEPPTIALLAESESDAAAVTSTRESISRAARLLQNQ